MDAGPRKHLGSPGVLGGLAALSALGALFVRAPEGASFSLLVAVNGPRLLLALAAGAPVGVRGPT